MRSGPDGFVDAMSELDLSPRVEAGLVVCRVTPVAGARAGSAVEVGVAVDELVAWPETPPHWIHLPREVGFPRTNSQPSPKEGWLKHSRNIPNWGSAPARDDWATHIQAVLKDATS